MPTFNNVFEMNENKRTTKKREQKVVAETTLLHLKRFHTLLNIDPDGRRSSSSSSIRRSLRPVAAS